MFKTLSQEDREFLSILESYGYGDIESIVDAPSYIMELWCAFAIKVAKEDSEILIHNLFDYDKIKTWHCVLNNITFEQFNNYYNDLTYKEAERIYKEKILKFKQFKRCERFHDYFSPHTDWYEYIDGVGYIPTQISPLRAVLTMLEYNICCYDKDYKEYITRRISERVKFLIEKGNSKKKIVLLALSEGGCEKIEEWVKLEKEIQQLRDNSEKLTRWPECSESN